MEIKKVLFDYFQGLITYLDDEQFFKVFEENEDLFQELNSKSLKDYKITELIDAINVVKDKNWGLA